MFPSAPWRTLTQPYVRPAVPGPWRSVEDVWVVDENGDWQIAWSRLAGSPVSVTIAYQTTPGTQVAVSWVPASPALADGYRIYRPDGTLAGSTPASATSFVDPNPRPLNGSYTVRGILGGTEGPVTSSNVLDLRLQPGSPSTTVNSNGTASSTVTISWSHNALGRADQYAIYRGGAHLLTVGGTSTTATDPNPVRGATRVYEVRSVLSTVEGAGAQAPVTSVGAMPPTNVQLNATNPPLSNLRLTWGHPGGSRTGYQVQTNPPGWNNHQSLGSAGTQSNWATTSSGYMRVRTLSGGGPSVWVQRGPVAPINDVTPPANATIQSFKPEASYGRMVVRFTTPNDADFHSFRIQYYLKTPSYQTAWTSGPWTNANRNTAYARVTETGGAGWIMYVRIQVRDNDMNIRTGPTQARTLAPSPTIVDPTASVSGTYRANTGGWRNDSTRSTLEMATGGTSSGQNCGCWFYGTAIQSAVGGKTVVSATLQYWRENEGGYSGAVRPMIWTHNLQTRVGNPVPGLTNGALGPGVARTGTTSAVASLTAGQIAALVSGTRRGLALYRTGGSGDPDSYYMLLPQGNAVGGNPSRRNGRLTFSHLG